MKDIKYPNIVFCEKDSSLFDDYIKPINCMDLKKIWESYIPRNEFGNISFPCPGIEAFDYTEQLEKEAGN